MEDKLSDDVREELRRELWADVREEVKDDLRTVLKPVLEEELRAELAQGRGPASPVAGEAPGDIEQIFGIEFFENMQDKVPPGSGPARGRIDPGPTLPAGYGAEAQLQVIRQIREELAPRIQKQLIEDLERLTGILEEEARAKRIEDMLSDPEYCMERLREFLFPDQPVLWEKVKPLIDAAQWKIMVRILSGEEPSVGADKLDSSRALIREALMIKAEIEEEKHYVPAATSTSTGQSRAHAINKVLAGAEEMLDFALKSISGIIEETPV
jgi:hypothetical protein